MTSRVSGLLLVAWIQACTPAVTEPPVASASSQLPPDKSGAGGDVYRSLDFEKMLHELDGDQSKPAKPAHNEGAEVPASALSPKHSEGIDKRVNAEPPSGRKEDAVVPAAKLDTTSPSISFPSAVAGFRFGMDIPDTEFVCTDGLNRDLGRNGMPFNTYLAGDGADRYCPFAAEPLDFLRGGVSLHFVGGRLVWVTVTPESWAAAVERISAKYGSPIYQWDGHSFVPPGPQLIPGRAVAWGPAGGKIVMRSNATHELVFASDRADELRDQGF